MKSTHDKDKITHKPELYATDYALLTILVVLVILNTVLFIREVF